MEQPELGSLGVARDSVSVQLDWQWETGWRLLVAERLSGSDRWRSHQSKGLDAAEVHAAVCDALAVALGLA